jgi:hypothetical protein
MEWKRFHPRIESRQASGLSMRSSKCGWLNALSVIRSASSMRWAQLSAWIPFGNLDQAAAAIKLAQNLDDSFMSLQLHDEDAMKFHKSLPFSTCFRLDLPSFALLIRTML